MQACPLSLIRETLLLRLGLSPLWIRIDIRTASGHPPSFLPRSLLRWSIYQRRLYGTHRQSSPSSRWSLKTGSVECKDSQCPQWGGCIRAWSHHSTDEQGQLFPHIHYHRSTSSWPSNIKSRDLLHPLEFPRCHITSLRTHWSVYLEL